MRVSSFVCVLWAGLALAQANSSPAAPAAAGQTTAPATTAAPAAPAQTAAPQTSAPAAAPTPPRMMPQRPSSEGEADGEGKVVAPTVPVIIVKGICPNTPASKGGATAKAGAAGKSAAAKADCQTVLTKAQFEKLANALQPSMPSSVKRQLANAYPRLLAMANEAHKRGLDKGSSYQAKMDFARMQVLAQELNQSIQDEAARVPQAELTDYYNKNKAGFEQANLQRILVPRTKQMAPASEAVKPEEAKAKQQENEQAMTKKAESLRERAAAGEDFEKLQKEAYDFAGFTSPPPPLI